MPGNTHHETKNSWHMLNNGPFPECKFRMPINLNPKKTTNVTAAINFIPFLILHGCLSFVDVVSDSCISDRCAYSHDWLLTPPFGQPRGIMDLRNEKPSCASMPMVIQASITIAFGEKLQSVKKRDKKNEWK